MIVLSGGTAEGTTVSSGADVLVSGGTAISSFLGGGGSETVFSGGTTISTVISGPGTETVVAGGVATGTYLLSNAAQVLSGGTASDTAIEGGGFQFVSAGGVADSAGVGPYGTQDVYNSGVASYTVVSGDGAQSVLSGGTAAYTSVYDTGIETVQSGGVASYTAISGGGVQVVQQGAFAVSTNVSAYGSQVISGGGTATYTVVSSGASEIIDSGGTAISTTLLSGGIIDLAGFGYNVSDTLSFNSATDVLTISGGGSSTSLQLAGSYTGEYFHISGDGGSGTDITVDGTPCYCAGTLILTDRGEVPVEDLAIGDFVRVRSGAVRPIRWIGRRSYSGVFAARNKDVLPVIIRQGALDGALPRRDLHVSPLHAMYIDGVLIPAAALVNGISIVQASRVDEVSYFHIELPSHDVIYAEGAESESFVDDDSRGMFQNAAEYAALYPGAVRGDALYCAPLLTDGAEVARIWQRLAARAPKAA
jgi:autotransporter passenger strand-loop-strand repeat protein